MSIEIEKDLDITGSAIIEQGSVKKGVLVSL